MSLLPNAHLAIIDERKITAYLLSMSHPVGRSKALFFQQFGFRVQDWQKLRDALLEHARTVEVASVVPME